MIYPYECPNCGSKEDIIKLMKDCARPENCKKCGAVLKRIYKAPFISTRDTFGISKSFIDERTGKEIDTYKKWEKAGFKDPLDVVKKHDLKEKIKEGVEKRKYRGDRKLQNSSLPL